MNKQQILKMDLEKKKKNKKKKKNTTKKRKTQLRFLKHN